MLGTWGACYDVPRVEVQQAKIRMCDKDVKGVEGVVRLSEWRWDVRNALEASTGARRTHRVGVYEAWEEKLAPAKLNKLSILSAVSRKRALKIVRRNIVETPGDVTVWRDTDKRARQGGIRCQRERCHERAVEYSLSRHCSTRELQARS